MDITQLKSEIQVVIEKSPDKALENVMDYLKKVRASLEVANAATQSEQVAVEEVA